MKRTGGETDHTEPQVHYELLFCFIGTERQNKQISPLRGKKERKKSLWSLFGSHGGRVPASPVHCLQLEAETESHVTGIAERNTQAVLSHTHTHNYTSPLV